MSVRPTTKKPRIKFRGLPEVPPVTPNFPALKDVVQSTPRVILSNDDVRHTLNGWASTCVGDPSKAILDRGRVPTTIRELIYIMQEQIEEWITLIEDSESND